MKNYMAVFLGSPAGMERWKSMDEATRKDRERAGVNAWSNWVKEHEKQIVADGSPLGKTKLVNKSGVSDSRNNLTAFTVVRAESHDAAAKMFVNHPHFTIFPGDGVEIMECLPVPKM